MDSTHKQETGLCIYKPKDNVAYKFNSNILRTRHLKSLYLFVKLFYIFTCITYIPNYSTITCVNTHVNRDSMTNKIRSYFSKK